MLSRCYSCSTQFSYEQIFTQQGHTHMYQKTYELIYSLLQKKEPKKINSILSIFFNILQASCLYASCGQFESPQRLFDKKCDNDIFQMLAMCRRYFS